MQLRRGFLAAMLGAAVAFACGKTYESSTTPPADAGADGEPADA